MRNREESEREVYLEEERDAELTAELRRAIRALSPEKQEELLAVLRKRSGFVLR